MKKVALQDLKNSFGEEYRQAVERITKEQAQGWEDGWEAAIRALNECGEIVIR